MKEKKQPIKCSECKHCDGHRRLGNTRTSFYCEHPDQKHILDYFHEKGLSKMPGFLGFGEAYSDIVPIKTSPAWCPKKKVECDSTGGTQVDNKTGI